jgi:hypothetical protein
MAELFECDVLQHVANACVFDVEGLDPILQGGSQLASCASELFQEISPEASVNRGSRTQPVDFRDQTMRWNTESSAIWLLG